MTGGLFRECEMPSDSTPPVHTDFVNAVLIETIGTYISHPVTNGAIRQLLRLLQEIAGDPENTQSHLDQFYLKVRDEHDRKSKQ